MVLDVILLLQVCFRETIVEEGKKREMEIDILARHMQDSLQVEMQLMTEAAKKDSGNFADMFVCLNFEVVTQSSPTILSINTS